MRKGVKGRDMRTKRGSYMQGEKDEENDEGRESLLHMVVLEGKEKEL